LGQIILNINISANIWVRNIIINMVIHKFINSSNLK
jgi:hypothetical protein